jgi:sortase A
MASGPRYRGVRRTTKARRGAATTQGRGPTLDRVTLARVLGFVGRAFLFAGFVVLAFALHQLWGTGLQEARAQDDLRAEFRAQLREQREQTPTPASAPGAPPATAAPVTPVSGDAVAVLRIPRIGVDKAVVEGVSRGDLRKGPGHYPGTPLPGQQGNVAIAGHRTTYGAPFYRLDQLEPGDVITTTTRQGEFRYVVEGKQVVRPSQGEALNPTLDNRLTLTTCHPRFSASRRLVVTAGLQGPVVPSPPPATDAATGGNGGAGGAGGDGDLAVAEDPGLDGDPAALAPALLWGAMAAAVAGITWGLGRAWRRWPAYLLGVPAFLVVLFVCFEYVGRLLPANV